MKLRTAIRQALDPVELWKTIYHTEPDAWQAAVLRSDHHKVILNASRQAGKSSTVAIKALHIGLFEPGSLTLLVSRSLRQSVELGRKVFDAYRCTGRTSPPESESKLALELRNGSRIVCLPGGDEGGIRGYSGVRALIIDEASRCPDPLFVALRPMIAVSAGSITLLSTPFGKRGFFYQAWAEGDDWLKIEVKASQCPRLSPTFLEQERRELGPRWYSQEYDCGFVEAIGQLFSDEAIDLAFRNDIAPLFPMTRATEGDAILTDQPPLFPGGSW
jgi:Terminase large subunit, T4likevirus-type, N-terminal